MTVVIYSSLTRMSDLDSAPFDVSPLPKTQWATGDFVVGKITGPRGQPKNVETASGRMINAMRGDNIVGAIGNRSATLEAVGSWTDISDSRMHAMTSAGLFGYTTSLSPIITTLTELTYVGHVKRNGVKVAMSDYAVTMEHRALDVPTVLLFGTSMSAGKTTAGRLIVHEIARSGYNVIGAKLTGAGRFRDILSFKDAGASAVFDFVDAGLPSTVVPENVFRHAVRPLLSKIQSLEPDVLVVEAGASPLEPYNGRAAVEELGNNIRCRVLCASDPYAVVGVQNAFGLTPDFVAGPAAATSAAIDLVRELTDLPALNVLDPDAVGSVAEILSRCLGLRLDQDPGPARRRKT